MLQDRRQICPQLGGWGEMTMAPQPRGCALRYSAGSVPSGIEPPLSTEVAELAATLRDKKRASPKEVEQTLLALCRGRYLTPSATRQPDRPPCGNAPHQVRLTIRGGWSPEAPLPRAADPPGAGVYGGRMIVLAARQYPPHGSGRGHPGILATGKLSAVLDRFDLASHSSRS